MVKLYTAVSEAFSQVHQGAAHKKDVFFLAHARLSFLRNTALRDDSICKESILCALILINVCLFRGPCCLPLPQTWWSAQRLMIESSDPHLPVWSKTHRSAGSRGRSWSAVSLHPFEPHSTTDSAALAPSETCRTYKMNSSVNLQVEVHRVMSKNPFKHLFWPVEAEIRADVAGGFAAIG